MSNLEKAAREIKSPFNLPSIKKYRFQSSYLYYINQFTPEVSEKLTLLTAQCVKLFGEYPLDDNNFEESRRLNWKISRVFNCVWREKRESEGQYRWLEILRENNQILKNIHDFESSMNQKADDYIESLTEKGLDELKIAFSSNWSKAEKDITVQDLKYAYRHFYWKYFFDNNEDFKEVVNTKYSQLDDLIKFQNDFDSLLDEIVFSKIWLGWVAFKAIWNGTGILQLESSEPENIPTEIIIEIKERLKIQPQSKSVRQIPKSNGEFRLNDFGFFDKTIPPPNPFENSKAYNLYDSFEYYQEQAVESYRQYIAEYLKVIKESFEKFGYKQNRKRHDFTRVKWLVWWNIKKLTKDQILEEISLNDAEKNIEDLSSIDKAFRQFKKYDLPVRV